MGKRSKENIKTRTKATKQKENNKGKIEKQKASVDKSSSRNGGKIYLNGNEITLITVTKFEVPEIDKEPRCIPFSEKKINIDNDMNMKMDNKGKISTIREEEEEEDE